MPACYQCLLKAYNVSACYQMFHKWEATWMLVTNCPLVCHQTSPCLSAVSHKKGTYTQLDMSNCNWGNQAKLKQPCSFYSVRKHILVNHNVNRDNLAYHSQHSKQTVVDQPWVLQHGPTQQEPGQCHSPYHKQQAAEVTFSVKTCNTFYQCTMTDLPMLNY